MCQTLANQVGSCTTKKLNWSWRTWPEAGCLSISARRCFNSMELVEAQLNSTGSEAFSPKQSHHGSCTHQ